MLTACAGGNEVTGPAPGGSAPSTPSGASFSATPTAAEATTTTGVPTTPQQSDLSDPSSAGGSVSSSGIGAEITISGVMIEGLRPNCRILQTDQRRYALTGPGTADLRVGEQVTVTGRPRPDLLSPCGSIFVVSSLR
jgi:hypothetical protein